MRPSIPLTILCAAWVAALGLTFAVPVPPTHAGDKAKVLAVGKDGLKLEGNIAEDSPKAKVVVGTRSGELAAKLFLVKLSAGKRYRLAMDSDDLDSMLIVQNNAGQQLGLDDDSGGGLNALLTFDAIKGGTYKVYAAALKGTGPFKLKITEAGAAKVHDVGKGLKLDGELGKTLAVTYNVKLVAGKTYVIDMIANDQKTLDPFLRLLDADGKQLAEDDDGGDGLNARITHKAENTGTYQVIATCLPPRGQGMFTLNVAEQAR